MARAPDMPTPPPSASQNTVTPPHLPGGTPPGPPPPPSPSLRELWQVPIFVLGTLALLIAWFARPLVPENPQHRLTRDLETARQLLARKDGETQTAIALAERALADARQFPERTGEALFVLGSAHLHQAEQLNPALAGADFKKARQYLKEAESQGVPEELKGQLLYRLAKVDFYTGSDLDKVIAQLEESADQAEDQAESYGLLTQAYLRKQPPELEKALEANRKQRQAPLAQEEVLAPARLLGGELLLRLGRPAEARKTLELVGEHAPAAVLAQARMLRARSYQEESMWSEAAKLYEVALADNNRVPLPHPARAYYSLGLCYRQLDQPDAARAKWEECLRITRGGVEVQPAALELALLDSQGLHPEKALEALQTAVGEIQEPEQWTNPVVDLTRARQVFEQVARNLIDSQRHDLVIPLTHLYVRIAPPGRAQTLRGEVSAAWARVLKEQARNASSNEDQQKAEIRARALFAQAGQAYALAAKALTETAQLDALWLAARYFHQCQSHDETIAILERFLRLSHDPEKKGKGYFLLAEAYRQAQRPDEAEAAYRECVKFPTVYQYRARFQLAMNALARGALDDAEADLELNLKLLRFDPDPEAQEKSLFALGDLFYQRGNFRMVVRRLGEALDRYPDNPDALRAQYQLADSYRRLASQYNQAYLIGENMSTQTQQHFQREHLRWLRKAAEEFTRLDEKLRKNPELQGLVGANEQLEVPFSAARCLFHIGEYEKALQIYERLSEDQTQPLRKVESLGGAVSCHAALGDINRVLQRLIEIRLVLPQLEEKQQVLWERWVTEISKGLHAKVGSGE
jgi:tetratricopeptide (TPR) repeat protein